MSKIFTALELNPGALPQEVMRALEDGPAAPPKPVADRRPVEPDCVGIPRPTAGSPAGELANRPAQSGASGEWNPARARVLPVRISVAAALLSPEGGQSYAAEQYRIIRTKITQRLSKPFQLVVTSPGIGDGKTVTSVNLAVALALKGEGPTLLIDADLRRTGVHRRLQTPQGPGLTEVLAGKCCLQEAVFRAEQLPALHVLPSGEPEGNPAELLDSSRWRALGETVRHQFQHVVVDSPPVEILADYDLIAAVCDGVLLVVRPDHTDRALCLAALAKVRPKLTGVLINAAEEWFLWRKPPHHYYSYYEHNGKPRSGGKDERTE